MKHIWNIEGCIGYRDFNEASKWLQRASVELSPDEFKKLIIETHEFIISDKEDLYSTPIYNILIQYNPELAAGLIVMERELIFSERFYKSLIESQSPYSDIFHKHLELVRHGYNLEGYNSQGFNRDGFNKYGFDRNGYNIEGYDREGFNREGIDKAGFNRDGFNYKGFDRQGFRKDGFNIEGFDRQGFNHEGIDENGFNKDGYGINGYDKNGFNSIGVNRYGYISPAKWHEIVVAITHISPPNYQNEWSAAESCSELNDQDLAFAGKWASAEKNNDYTLAS